MRISSNIKQLAQLLSMVSNWAREAGILSSMMISSTCINILALVFPLMLLQVYDRIIPQASLSTLSVLVMLIGGAVVVESVLRVLRAMTIAWADAQFSYRTSCRGFNAILDTPITEYAKHGAGSYIEKMNALNYMKDFYGGQALVSLIDLPFILLYLGLIGYLAGSLVLVPITILSGFVAVALVYGELTHKTLSDRRFSDDRRVNFIIEILSKMHTVKSMSMENQFARRYERLQKQTAGTDHQLSHYANRTQTLSTLLSQSNVIFVVSMGSLLVMNGQLSIGGLAACTLLANRTLGPISRAMGVWRRLQNILVAEERLQQLLELPNEFKSENINQDETKSKQPASIKLNNVSFQYEGNDKATIDRLSFAINANETVGIETCENGGKTTLVMLIMGLYQATEGELQVAGQPINSVDLAAWRDRIAYIPERGALFNGTILDNITLFRRKTHLDKALVMIERLGFNQAIDQLPDGLETRIGDKLVSTLPLGLQQQICIARALVDDRDVLIFDEGNSSLDSRANQHLLNTLSEEKSNYTIILFSQHKQILALADRCVTLSHGSILEKAIEPGNDTRNQQSDLRHCI